jgi:hypothetical protein
MPTFYTEDIDIEVDEFLSSCSESEREELINCLVKDGNVFRVGKNGMPISNKRGPLEDEHIGKCLALGEKFYAMSNEDLELLQTLYTKYA